jgi:hypothetical protein
MNVGRQTKFPYQNKQLAILSVVADTKQKRVDKGGLLAGFIPGLAAKRSLDATQGTLEGITSKYQCDFSG